MFLRALLLLHNVHGDIKTYRKERRVNVDPGLFLGIHEFLVALLLVILSRAPMAMFTASIFDDASQASAAASQGRS